jgi:hypothetical protein
MLFFYIMSLSFSMFLEFHDLIPDLKTTYILSPSLNLLCNIPNVQWRGQQSGSLAVQKCMMRSTGFTAT